MFTCSDRYYSNLLDDNTLFTHRTTLSPSFSFPLFRRCFHVILNRLCLEARSNMGLLLLCLGDLWLLPTMDVGFGAMFWPKRAAALAPHSRTKPAVDGDGYHSPLPSPSLEISHWEAAPHYRPWQCMSCLRTVTNSMNLARRNVSKLHYSSEKNTWIPLGNKYNNTGIEKKESPGTLKGGNNLMP